MAVAEGFEPSDGGYPSHAFEACSLGRSDTPPPATLPETGPRSKSAGRRHIEGNSGTCVDGIRRGRTPGVSGGGRDR